MIYLIYSAVGTLPTQNAAAFKRVNVRILRPLGRPGRPGGSQNMSITPPDPPGGVMDKIHTERFCQTQGRRVKWIQETFDASRMFQARTRYIIEEELCKESEVLDSHGTCTCFFCHALYIIIPYEGIHMTARTATKNSMIGLGALGRHFCEVRLVCRALFQRDEQR